MSFAKIRHLLDPLPVRLTSLFAGTTFLALAASWVVLFLVIRGQMLRNADHYLIEEAHECLTLYQAKGLPALEEEIRNETASQGTRDIYFRVVRDDGSIVAESNAVMWKDMIPFFAFDRGAGGVPAGSQRPANQPPARYISCMLDAHTMVWIGLSLRIEYRLIRETTTNIGLIMLALWLATVVLGALLSRRALSGIKVLRDAARGLADGQLAQRVPVAGRQDEVYHLSRAFNEMAEKIQQLMDTMRQTNDNIAHELRSPITRIRSRAELALTTAQDAALLREATADSIEECDSLLTLINTMLEIGELESGVSRLPVKKINLNAVVTDVCDLFLPVAEDLKVHLHCQIEGENGVCGNLPKLQRMISNLVDNAIKYASHPGEVWVELRHAEAGPQLSVRDSGPGIPSEEVPHIFQRFFRGRNGMNLPGNGLGLSLVRAVAQMHQAVVSIDSSTQRGTTVSVQFKDCAAETADIA